MVVVNPFGNPAGDHILYRDEMHARAMERGSTRLRHALEDYYVARAQSRPMKPIGEMVA